jgi:fructokinase
MRLLKKFSCMSPKPSSFVAALELGGTKTVVATGHADGRVVEEFRFPTTTPEETLGRAIHWLAERGCPAALGVGAFGPLRLDRGRADYGCVLATPKAGWSNFSVIGKLRAAFPEVALRLDTDVNAALLAEIALGAAQGATDAAYLTVGTGIGAGILSGGKLVHGALHPEFGHLKVPPAAGDSFVGVCPFHGDCLEGLASGPALQARWGKAAAALPADHAAWELEAWYLAHGILALLAIISPSRVIVGGGVSQVMGLHEKITARLSEIANGYFETELLETLIAQPALGQQAGVMGALLMAGEAVA